MTKFPEASKEELHLSQLLTNKLKEKIGASNNWLSFSDFMNMALYDPHYGYYTAPSEVFGPNGDFVTAPNISNLFAGTFFNHFVSALKKVDNNILEIGSGNGCFCKDILLNAENEGVDIANFFILEISKDLIDRQKTMLQKDLSDSAFKKIVWVKKIPAEFKGIIFTNELFDALPADIYEIRGHEPYKKGVTIINNELEWQLDKKPNKELASKLPLESLPEHYNFEYCEQYDSLLKEFGEAIDKAVVYIVDYGFTESEYFHIDRSEGTLMCHFKHYAHSNPLVLIGLQDITSHVNFSHIARIATQLNFKISLYTSQANFLINAGILNLMEKISPEDKMNYVKMSSGIQTLVSPSEMGDLVKVMAITKNIDLDFAEFSRNDRTFNL